MAGFADTDALIDYILEKHFNVSSSDANASPKRARILGAAQRALDEICAEDDWLFSYKTSTVSISSGANTGDLPADFMEFGEVGGIFEDNTDVQWGEGRPVDVYSGVIQGLTGDSEELASNFGWNTSNGRRTIRTRGNVGAATTLTILYRATTPALTDQTGTTTSGLYFLPASYHYPVLLPKILMFLDIDHGDINRTEEDYKRGLSAMRRRERARKTSPQFIQPFNQEGMF